MRRLGALYALAATMALPSSADSGEPLRIDASACAPQAYACNLGEQPAALSASDCQSGDGRAFDLYSFAVDAGELITATMHPFHFAGYLAVVDSRGQIVRTSQAGTALAPAFVAFEAPVSGVYDLIASSSVGVGGYRLALGCLPIADAEELPLGAGRFRVAAWWQTTDGRLGRAKGEALSADTGVFWYFLAGTAEVVVKVLDGCKVNGHAWVFAAGLTDVHTALRVTDAATGREAWSFNPHRTAFRPVQDTTAIPCG